MISADNKIMRLLSVLIVAGFLAGFGCSSPSGGDDDDDGGGGGGGDDPVTYELSASANPSEGGSVNPESGTFDEGEEVEVTATADEGWEFSEWTGDISSSENPLTFTINENTSLTAQFTEIQTEPTTYELSVAADPSEGGSVNPSSGTYEEGEQIEVTATAAEGWTFTGWSGDISSSDNPLNFTINQDTDLTASFEGNAKSYSNQIEVIDGDYPDPKVLTFGMQAGASDGFDSGLDEWAPPDPPPGNGSFYARFKIPDENLYTDYRPIQNQKTVWEIHFGTSSSNNIVLNWDFNSSDYHGNLTLTDDPDNATLQIDMSSESSYEPGASVNTLYIIHQ